MTLVVCVAIFKCDSCGYERDVPGKLVGKKAKCPECRENVTIVDDGMAEELAAIFAEDGPVESDQLPEAEEHGFIDLDKVDKDLDLSSEADVVCDECGVVNDSNAPRCLGCGRDIKMMESHMGLEEGDIDVSDLADDPPPQIWDSNFDDEGETASLEEEEDEAVKGTFFAGNPFLNIFSGIVSGLLSFFLAFAMALLAASQTGMHEFLPVLFTTTLVGMAAGTLFFSLQSRIPFALAGPGVALTGVLSFFLGTIYQHMVGLHEPDEIMATLLAAIILTSLIAGFGLWILGMLRAGNLIRFVPIQVIGGVLAGVGVYVVIGALDQIGHLQLDWSHLFLALADYVRRFNPAESLSVMGPSVMFGLILFIGLARHRNALFLLALLFIACGAGYAASIWGDGGTMRSLSYPVTDLLGGVPLVSIKALTGMIADVQWRALADHGLYIGATGCLMALTGVYRLTRMELKHGREVDQSMELRSLGMTNMLVGLCGGMSASVNYGRSAGNHAAGARGALAGVIAGLVVGLGLFFADRIIPFIPRFVPEGLLLFTGLALIRGWGIKARTAFTRRDDLWMLWVAFLTTIIFGMLIGIGFGVALAFLVTVRRSSLGGPVRSVLSGSMHRSNVDRASAQQRVLKEYGDHIHIVRLQGFLFLGSMEELLETLHQRLSDRNLLQVEYVVLDFHLVTGLAAAAEIGFRKLRRLVDEYDIELVIASAPLELEEHLADSHLLVNGGGGFRVFLDLDYAMEWCENRVLDSENLLQLKERPLASMLEPLFPVSAHLPALMKVLKKVHFKRGEVVFRQGDVSDSMYFVESGRLDVELELEDGKLIRLKKVGPGAVVGEMGIYTLTPRSATVRATEKSVLYLMTTEKLEAIEKRAPQLVASIHRYMINLLAERLADANFKVRELMR